MITIHGPFWTWQKKIWHVRFVQWCTTTPCHFDPTTATRPSTHNTPTTRLTPPPRATRTSHHGRPPTLPTNTNITTHTNCNLWQQSLVKKSLRITWRIITLNSCHNVVVKMMWLVKMIWHVTCSAPCTFGESEPQMPCLLCRFCDWKLGSCSCASASASVGAVIFEERFYTIGEFYKSPLWLNTVWPHSGHCKGLSSF